MITLQQKLLLLIGVSFLNADHLFERHILVFGVSFPEVILCAHLHII